MLVTCQSLIKLTSGFISVLSMLLIFIFFHNSLILWECIFFICFILTPKINSVTNDIHILPAGMSTVCCWQDFYLVYVPPLKLFIIQINATSLNSVNKSWIGSKTWIPFNILSFYRVDYIQVMLMSMVVLQDQYWQFGQTFVRRHVSCLTTSRMCHRAHTNVGCPY